MITCSPRDPATIPDPGTYPLPGMPGCRLTYGRDATLQALPELMRHDWLAVDIETDGLGVLARQIKVVTIATPDHAVLLDPRDPAQYQAIRDVLATKHLIIHRSAYDVPALAYTGLLTEADTARVTDTLIYARLADPDEHADRDLAACARRYLGMTGVGDTVTQRAKTLGITKAAWFRTADLDRPAYRWDAATDGIVTARLYPAVRRAAYERITTGHPFTVYGLTGAEAWELVDREQRINRMFLARTIRGLRWDPEYLDAYRDRMARDVAAWEAELAEHGIRPGNSADLVKALERAGMLPDDWPRTPTGQLSGDKTHLKKLADSVELVRVFLRHKEATKVERDYLSKVADLADENGRIHPVVNVLGASATGRMSIQDPPLQQFDAQARGIILADHGDELVSIDWSQIEPVTAANVAGDTAVLERYENDALPPDQRDAYLGIAEIAGITRKQAKVVLLAQMYGEGLRKLAADLGLITPAESEQIRVLCERDGLYPAEAAARLGINGFRKAQAIRDAVFQAMPRTAELIKKLQGIGREYGVIITISGRILPIPYAEYRGRREPMTHKAVNYFVQGSAYDILADTLIRVIDAGLGDAVYLAIHDELVVSRDAAEDIRRIMSTPPERLCLFAKRRPVLRTDMEVLGKRWAKPE